MTAPAMTELDGVYRKIFQRLVSFLMVLWVLAWIDRVNIGFIKLTMLDDLKWSEAVYGLGAGIFFLGYFFFEVPISRSELFRSRVILSARLLAILTTQRWLEERTTCPCQSF
jgi:hypothetical protein